MTSSRRAEAAMEIWAVWYTSRQELGWPSISSEVRAYQAAQTATKTDGIARWRGRGTPPQVPKETVQSRGAIVPRFDLSRTGPRIDSILSDLSQDSPTGAMSSLVLKLTALAPPKKRSYVAAQELSISERHVRRLRKMGFEWLDHWLMLIPRH